jgi:hypothetical protein
MGLVQIDWIDGYGAGAVKNGLVQSDGLVVTGEPPRSLTGGN